MTDADRAEPEGPPVSVPAETTKPSAINDDPLPAMPSDSAVLVDPTGERADPTGRRLVASIGIWWITFAVIMALPADAHVPIDKVAATVLPEWRRPELVGPLTFGIAFLGFLIIGIPGRPGRGRIAAMSCTAMLVAAWASLADTIPEMLQYVRSREDQSCAECRDWLPVALGRWAMSHDGWFPRGGRDQWDSLAKLVTDGDLAEAFTSHALAEKARRTWEETGSLTDEVSCYGYNEGLRVDDPGELIVCAYETPGKWECSVHVMKEEGRTCLVLSGRVLEWRFVEEASFGQLQRRTRDLLRRRERGERIEPVEPLTPGDGATIDDGEGVPGPGDSED